MSPIPAPVLWSLAAVTLVAALTDMRSRRIPNWLCATGVLLGFVVNTYLTGWAGLASAGMGFGLALLIYVPLFAIRAMGGGDVKLMAAVGALAGPTDWFTIFILASALGGMFALGLMVVKSRLGFAFSNIWYILCNLARLRAPYAERPDLDVANPGAVTMPHGVAIAAGTFMFLFVR